MRDFKPLFTWRSAIVESDLQATVKHVALNLSLHMNERGGSCFPGIDLQAEETGRDRATVIRALNTLEEQGFLKRTRPTKPGPGQFTEYEAIVPGGSQDATDLAERVAPGAEWVATDLPSGSRPRDTRSSGVHQEFRAPKERAKPAPIPDEVQERFDHLLGRKR